MAKAVSIIRSSVRRIWGGARTLAARVRIFKISNDPTFADKLKDVVGLYFDPPADAIVPALTRKPIPGA
jgi:hypothetical protein